jgi:uncharacterized paraquat-inducible protein A
LAGGPGDLVIFSLGTHEEASCSTCGFALTDQGDCPRCKLIRAETGRELLQQRQETAAVLDEAEEILRDSDI